MKSDIEIYYSASYRTAHSRPGKASAAVLLWRLRQAAREWEGMAQFATRHGTQAATWAARRSRMAVAFVCALMVGGVLCVSGVGEAGAAGLAWRVSTSYPPLPDMSSISCPSSTSCAMLGQTTDGAVDVMWTTDAGDRWRSHLLSSASAWPSSVTPQSIVCPSTTTCFALGWLWSNHFIIGNAILASTNGGATWVEETSAEEIDGLVCPTTTTCYAVGYDLSGTVVLATTDGGKDWVPSVLSSTTGAAVIACPTPTTCYAVESGGEEYVTTDGWATWTADPLTWSADAPSPHGLSLKLLACPTATTCYAAGQDKTRWLLIATKNGGGSWTVEEASRKVSNLKSMACPTATTCYVVGQEGVAYVTHDGGTTWKADALPPKGADLESISCPGATCYAAGGGKEGPAVVSTSSGGAKWVIRSLFAGIAEFEDLACPSITTCYGLGFNGFGASVASTTNGGGTWRRVGLPLAVGWSAIACSSATSCYVVGGPAIAATADGGVTWRVTTRSRWRGDSWSSVVCASASVCYVLGGGAKGMWPSGVALVTHDSGATWRAEPLPTGPTGPIGSLIMVFGGAACPSPTICYAVAAGDEGNVALVTRDGGETWKTEKMPPSDGELLAGISCPSATTCYAVSTGGTEPVVLSTTNGGATWKSTNVTTLRSNSWSSGISCPSATTCYAVLGGDIFSTSDGGSTWSAGTNAPKVESLSSIACPSTTTCYAVGVGSGGKAVIAIGTSR